MPAKKSKLSPAQEKAMSPKGNGSSTKKRMPKKLPRVVKKK